MKRLLLLTSAIAVCAAAGDALAQTPKRGGTIIIAAESEPPNYDCTNAGNIFIQPFVGPHYSQLVRYDQNNYPKIIGDLAESWTVSPDALTYTFKLRPNVKFHDGTTLTAEDIKATFDRIRNPPAGVTSFRRAEFTEVSSIDVIDPLTVAFKLSQRNSALVVSIASPYNCVFSARRLADNPKFPETTVMGTGPFVPSEYVKGQSWTGKRFDGYFRPGLPYLDGFKTVVMSPGSPINAMAAGQIDAIFRTLSPQEAETIRAARGSVSAFHFNTSVVNTLAGISFNTARKPYDDVRVRKALTLAIDRKGGLAPMKKITSMEAVGGWLLPGSPMALPSAELARMPGFGDDIVASRAEARRLLAEAGLSNLKFSIMTRDQTNPWQTLAIFAVDQWRQIGVEVDITTVTQPVYLQRMGAGDYDVGIDTNSTSSEDPTLVLAKMTPNAGNNYGKANDPLLGELFAKQKVALNDEERRPLVNQFERQVLNNAYFAPLFWSGWIGALGSNFHGWKPTPNYGLGYDLAEVWRD